MKKVYLMGFRGTGFRDAKYKTETALIRAGHVGIAFEGNEEQIIGFHPTAEAIEQIGGEDTAIEHLKAGFSLEGMLQEDYAVFVRAAELATLGARTEVWQMTIELPDNEFEVIRRQLLVWYTQGEKFDYAFPQANPSVDNCATFPRRLGLKLPEETGQILEYVEALKANGERWQPKEV